MKTAIASLNALAENAHTNAAIHLAEGRIEESRECQHNAEEYLAAAAHIDFFSAFDECLNRRPFLLMEVGYNRVTDWMVTIYDATGTRISSAQMIIPETSHDRKEAMSEAAIKLRDQFLSQDH